jgi:glucosamine--fructose-6-phosphate aminotransferase (isomerizing)
LKITREPPFQLPITSYQLLFSAMTEYIDNILGQPAALRGLLAELDLAPVHHLAARVQAGDFDRIILTGMGASFYAAYPAWTLLSAAGLPAWWLEAGELAETASALITPKTLLWIVSQAGRVPEGLALLNILSARPPGLVLATTNEPDSPLARRAGLVQPLHTAPEKGVATRSFVNTLAVTQLAALAMAGQSLAPALAHLRQAAEALAAYLAGWEQTAEQFAALLPAADRLLLLGRGASLSAALGGALVLKEAARANAEGLSMGQFRHGTLELADPRLTVLVFEGPAPLAADRRLAQTIAGCGARALLISSREAPVLLSLPAPVAGGIASPIAQIVPIQLLSLLLARRQGFEAAAFRHLGKVTWPDQAGPQLV